MRQDDLAAMNDDVVEASSIREEDKKDDDTRTGNAEGVKAADPDYRSYNWGHDPRTIWIAPRENRSQVLTLTLLEVDSWRDCCSFPYHDEVCDNIHAAVDSNEAKDGEVNVAVEDDHMDDEAKDDGDAVVAAAGEDDTPHTNEPVE